jgi:hypothetical protein
MRNTTMLKEKDLFIINNTPKNASKKHTLKYESSDSLSNDIEKNISVRKSQLYSRKLTPNSKSSQSNQLQLKPSFTLNDLSKNNELLNNITSNQLLFKKKRRTNPAKRTSDENEMETYYICESKKIADSQLDILRKSMRQSKTKNQDEMKKKKKSNCYLSLNESKKIEYCTKEQLTKLLKEKEFRINTYINGSYLGDEEILQKSNRLYNCRARTDVELMVLTKSDFEFYLLQEFPHVYEKIVKYAKEKRDHNEKCVKNMLRGIQVSAKYHDMYIKHVRKISQNKC